MISLVKLYLFGAVIAFLMAKLEINIEGQHGWAEKLPTKKYKNKLTKFLWGELHITGYHLWFLALMQVFLHFPVLFDGIGWSLNLELKLQSALLFATALEDFFWFVLNPHYGFKKFNKINAHWHDGWVGPIPVFYIKLLSFCALFLVISFWGIGR